MRWLPFRMAAAAGFLGIAIALVLAAPAPAQNSAALAQSALDDLHGWLATSSKGREWRSYLLSTRLQAELDRPDGPRAEVIEEVLAKYQGKRAGLELSRFVATRTALEALLEDLNTPVPPADQLADLVRQAKSRFTPISADDVAAAKAHVQKIAADLDRSLAPEPEKAAHWKELLQWDQLHQLLAAEGAPDLGALQNIARLYTQNEPGLEGSYFRALRQALWQYIGMSAVSGSDQAQTQYETQLDALAGLLEKHVAQPSADAAYEIGLRLGWLSRAQQVPDVVRAVRTHISRPNLLVQASRDFLAVGIERDVDERRTVYDNIIGTSITAQAHTKGNVTLQLVPDPHRASLRIHLAAVTNSDNVGYHDPVTIYSTGVTTIDANKALLFSPTGLSAFRAQANCTTRSNIYSIGARSRIVQNAAWKRVGQNKAQAERIGARHAEERVGESMDKETSKLLVEGNQSYDEKFRHPLLRRDAFPDVMHFSTTADFVNVLMLQANVFQVGSPASPPALNGPHDLAVRVQESMISNFAEATLGGETLTDEKLAEAFKKLSGEVPKELEIGPDDEPWSVTFVRQQPITVKFDNQEFEIIIRGRRFTSGDRKFGAMNVSARYKLEKTATGAKLTRQGEIGIFPPGFVEGKDKLSVSEVSLKSILQKKLADLFKPEIETDGLEFKDRWAKAGKMPLVQMDSEGGWLALGWTLPRGEERTAKAK